MRPLARWVARRAFEGVLGASAVVVLLTGREWWFWRSDVAAERIARAAERDRATWRHDPGAGWDAS